MRSALTLFFFLSCAAFLGGQELGKNPVPVLKASRGWGRIDKLNAAYAAGLTLKNPLGRRLDQAGFAAILNELGSRCEYGIDSYWRFFITSYMNVAPNVQAYYTVSDRISAIVGLRAFLTY